MVLATHADVVGTHPNARRLRENSPCAGGPACLGSDLWRNVPVVALVEFGSSVVDVEMIDTEIGG